AFSGAKSIVTPVIGNGWQRGIRSLVRLAAMIPASRATSNTSPFANALSRMRVRVAGCIRTIAEARASRAVSGLTLVSAMRLAPAWSKWERSDIAASEDQPQE